jgi:myosin heavy subunit
MSEADQPNNPPLPEPTVPSDDSGAQLLDATETVENLKIVKFSELPDVKPPVQPWKPDETTELETEATALLSQLEGDDATSESDDAGQKSTQDADWFALAQKMRQRNRNLQEQVNQLKAALKQKTEALYTEQTRSQQRETLLAQQTEEFNTVHEQLTRLFKALESSHQASQRQQILIETLSEQLQGGQERIAQLERECSFTQQRYNEQSHQLLQAANTCRDLRTRLQRQQQQTLQFKAALEKSLEMPTSTDTQQPHRSFVPKAQPIQPWSAEPGVLEEPSDFDTIWQHPVRLEPPQPVYFSKTEPFIVRRLEEPDFPSTAESTDLAESTQALQDITPPEHPEEALAASEEITASELELEYKLLAEMSSLAEAAGLTQTRSDFSDTPDITPWETQPEFNESATDRIDAQETGLPEDTWELPEQAQIRDEEIWGDSPSKEPTEPEVVLPQSNWPSPILYPLRPSKKRKSLAAIELPSFPRFYPS